MTLARTERWTVFAVGLAAAISAGLVWWATGPWGPGLSPDAVAYSAIAEGIRDRAELGYWLEPHVSSWPPLFPFALAGVSTLLDISVLDASRVVNTIVQGLTVIVVALLAQRLLRSTWLRAAAIGTAVVAQPLMFVAVKVWSEPLFNLLVLLTALVLARVPERHGSRWLLVASASAIAAFTTRYAGLVFVPAGLIVLLLWPRGSKRSVRISQALWFSLPAFAAGVALVAWNRWRTGEAFGPRWRPDEPFWDHALDGLAAIGTWFLPDGAARLPTVVVGIAVFGVIGVAITSAWHSHDSVRDDVARGEVDAARTVGVAPVLAVFSGCYFVYMVWARTSSGFDPLNSRLMLPIFLPALLLMLSLIDQYAATRAPGLSRQLILALPLVIVLPSVVGGLDELRDSHDIGNEYTNAAVRRFVASPILQQVPTDCTPITNDPWLLWLADRDAQLTPERIREVAIPQSMTLEDLTRRVENTDVCLVWLRTGSSVFYEPEELAAVVELHEVANDEFTTIYRLEPRP